MIIEETKLDTYKLSKQYFDHKSGVRCIDIHEGKTIATGSIDKTCKIYNKLNDSFDVKASTVQYAHGFVYSVKIFDQGYIIGSQDKKIYVLDKDLQLIQTLVGHQGPVNSLVYNNGKLISGSWDGTAKIWDLSTGLCEETLEGHKHAVCVTLLCNGIILTGSSDKCIRFWSKTDKYTQIKVINGAHGDIIRELNEISDFGFISCSNDETAKIWTYEGNEIQTIRGHTSFVYSAKCLSFGKYITCSEDKTLKIWNGEECIQTILHPGTIWCFSSDSATGIFVTGCADGVTRIFSLNANEWTNATEIEEFEKASQLAAVEGPEMQLSKEELLKMPSVDQMNQIVGKYDGEMRVFRNKDSANAYCWKQETRQWDLVGEVLNTIPTKSYPGDLYFAAGDYDYVFDVEDDSGEPKKLPFNDGDNPLEVADKYCAREGISRYHVQSICSFIKQNTKSKGQVNWDKKQDQGKDVKQKLKDQYKFFPMREYQFYSGGNLDGMQKKLIEFNEELKANNEPNALSENNVLYLKTFCENLKNEKNYLKEIIGHSELSLIEKLLQWPRNKILPVLDLFRLFNLHFQAEKFFKGGSSGQNIMIEISSILQANNESEVIKNLCLKVLCNQFKNIGNQTSFVSHWELIMDGIIAIVSMENKGANLSETLTFLLMNLSILIREKIRDKKKVEQVCICCGNSMQKEVVARTLLKLLISTGNMILVEEIKPIIVESYHNDLLIFIFCKELAPIIKNLNLSALQGESEDIQNVKDCLSDLNEIF